MIQHKLKFNNYEPRMVDEDGYQLQFAVTSTSNSGRTARGNMINQTMFTVEAYNLKWTNLSGKEVSDILKEVMGKDSFQFHHYNVYKDIWETSPFYVANINSPIISLKSNSEIVSELSFQVTGINPVT